MPGPVAIWAALQSAVLRDFQPRLGLWRAGARRRARCSRALYYAGRRQARGRRVSARGFVRSIFPRRILLHPSSLIDMRLWALNGDRLRLRLRHAGPRPVLLARRDRRRADPRIRAARARPLAGLDDPDARDRAADPGLRTRLLVRPLRFSQDPGAVGVPQGPPFRRGDDDAHRIAPAPGRDHRVHELDRARDRNRVRRHDLCLRPRRAPVHPAQRQHPHDGVPPDLRASAPQPHVDRVHRRRRPDPAESRPITSCITPPIPPISTRTSALRSPFGTGRSARSQFPPRRANPSFSASATRRRRSARRFPPSSRPARASPAMR